MKRQKRTLYEQQKRALTHTVTFYENGGTAVDDIPYVIDGYAIQEPSISRTAYDFQGWFTEPTFIHQWDFSTALTSNLFLYAKWTPTVYTITYVLGGETNSPQNPDTYTIESQTITFVDALKTGYSTVWSPVSIPAGSYGNVTVTATSYVAKQYEITFDKDGGASGTSSVTATYDSAMPEVTIPSKTGYRFVGYNIGATKYYNSDGSSARNWDVASDSTLTAQWELIYFYAAGQGYIRKYKVLDMGLVIQQATESSSTAFSMKKDATNIYVALNNGKIVKYNASTLAYVAEADYNGTAWALDIDDTHIYVGGGTSVGQAGRIKKYLKSDMSFVSQSELYDTQIGHITLDSTHVYVNGEGTGGKITKYLKSDLSLVAQTDVTAAGCQIVIDGDDLYSRRGSYLSKYSKSTLGLISQSSVIQNFNSLAVDDTHVFTAATGDGKRRKFLKSDLSLVTESSSANSNAYAVDMNSDFIFVGGDLAFERMKKYSKSSLALIASAVDFNGIIYDIVVEKE